jgi:hypothetical protein
MKHFRAGGTYTRGKDTQNILEETMNNGTIIKESRDLDKAYEVDANGNLNFVKIPDALQSCFRFTMVTRTGEKVIESMRRTPDK